MQHTEFAHTSLISVYFCFNKPCVFLLILLALEFFFMKEPGHQSFRSCPHLDFPSHQALWHQNYFLKLNWFYFPNDYTVSTTTHKMLSW